MNKKVLLVLITTSALVSCIKKEEKKSTQVNLLNEEKVAYQFTTDNQIDYFKTKNILLKDLVKKMDLSNFNEKISYSYTENNIEAVYHVEHEGKKINCKEISDYTYHLFQNLALTKTYSLEIYSNRKISGDDKCAEALSTDDQVSLDEFKTAKKNDLKNILNKALDLREQSVLESNSKNSTLDRRIKFSGNGHGFTAIAEDGEKLLDYQLTNTKNIATLFSQSNDDSSFQLPDLDLSASLDLKLTEICKIDFEYLGIVSRSTKTALQILDAKNEKKLVNCEYPETSKALTVKNFLDKL